MKPYLTICWNDTQSDAEGWLVIWNFVRGYTGGGIRMHPTVTRAEVESLAECMAYKYKACESTDCGGCKGGIAYDSNAQDALDVLERYIIAMMPYIRIGVSLGGDLGTKYGDILKIFKSCGIEIPLTPSMEKEPAIHRNMEAYDALIAQKVEGIPMNDMIAGYGVASAADEGWRMLSDKPAQVVIQGMGRVAFSCARYLQKQGHTIVGMADSQYFIYKPDGINVEWLRNEKGKDRKLDPAALPEGWSCVSNDEWLRYPCDILIPAALGGVIGKDNAGDIQADLIVEGANIPITSEADLVLQQNGKYLLCDYTNNLLEAWLYDAVFFGRIQADADTALREGDALCRRNAKLQMEQALRHGVYARESTRRLFEPDTQDFPEI